MLDQGPGPRIVTGNFGPARPGLGQGRAENLNSASQCPESINRLRISLQHHEDTRTVDLTITTFVYSIKSISCFDVVFNYSVSQKMKLSHTLLFF